MITRGRAAGSVLPPPAPPRLPARFWNRAESPLAPAREVRASTETLDALLAWVEGGERPEGREVERLGVFASGAVEDDSVPEGWVRIRLM